MAEDSEPAAEETSTVSNDAHKSTGNDAPNGETTEAKEADIPNPQHADFYQELRKKIRTWIQNGDGAKNKWVEYILCAPDLFHLLCRLVIDERVSLADKGKLAIAIAYFISPFDLMPEILMGPIGYLDDIAISSYVLNGIIKRHPDLVKEYWAGEGDVLELIERIITTADEMLGSGLIEKLHAFIHAKPNDQTPK